jgi:hypothetical protein
MTSDGMNTSDLDLPGFRLCTAVGTAIQIPIEEAGKEFGLLCMLPCYESTAYYPQIDIQRGNEGYAPGSALKAQLSSVEVNWDHYVSTSPFGDTSSYLSMWTIGPLDTARYACNFGGTSSNSIDKRQNFITIMVGYSSKAAGIPETHAKMSTQVCGGMWIGAIQLG